MLGNGVARYIVLPTTIGSPSWPRSTPVEKLHATFRFLTLSVVICPRSLYLVDDAFLLGIAHSLSFPVSAGAAAGAVDDAGAEPELHAAAATEQARPTRVSSLDTLAICAPLLFANVLVDPIHHDVGDLEVLLVEHHHVRDAEDAHVVELEVLGLGRALLGGPACVDRLDGVLAHRARGGVVA